MQIEKIEWGGWPNCYKLSNGTIELIVTTDVGPRVLHCGLVGGDNLFYVNENLLGKTGGDKWVNYGGHRLWHAPEDPVRTYVPDNGPVEIVETEEGGVEFRQPIEQQTGIQKTLYIELDEGAGVQVEHQLRNHGLWAVDLAIWGLSVMAAGGTAIMPLPERGTHPEALLPNTQLIFWPYSDLSDPRWSLGREYILLHQDSSAEHPQKFGAAVRDGWLAYVNNGVMFMKQFDYSPFSTYPDLGCNGEIFTNKVMLEVESLSRFYRLEPDTSVVHGEDWTLFQNVPTPANDTDVREHIQPLVDQKVGQR